MNETLFNPEITFVHPTDLALVSRDPTNYTISWTLYDPIDYYGTISFTDEPDGANPAGWWVSEPGDSHLEVIASHGIHRKVVRITGTLGNYPFIDKQFNLMPTYESATYEYYVRSDNDTLLGYQQTRNQAEVGMACSWLWFMWSDGTIRSVIDMGSTSQLVYHGLKPGFWYHIKVEHYAIDWIKVWVNNSYCGEFNTYTYARIGDHPYESHFDSLRFGVNGPGTFFVDAIDYSWSPGYYTNRNMDHDVVSNLIYAIFEDGIKKTNWQQWQTQVQVDYNVSGLRLGEGVHNISLVFNNSENQWFHDDVMVTVNSPVLDPITPNPDVPFGHWKLDESSGLTARDSVGNNNGTLQNMVGDEWEPAYVNGGLCFDGNNDWVDVGLQSYMSSSGSISLWFKPDVDTNTWPVNKWLFARNEIGNNAGDIAIWFKAATDKLEFFIQDGTHTRACESIASNFIAGTWYHVVGTWNASEIVLYINGVKQTDVELGINVSAHQSTGFAIAQQGTTTFVNGESFDGVIDDVRLYTTVVDSTLNSPVLDPITPNPDTDGIITLTWSDVANATQYRIYRDVNLITSVDALNPIGSISTNSYQDTITVNGTYYYVIVAGNAIGNSSISNCESVEVAIPLIEPTIGWSVPGVLDFEINLGEGRDCIIAFNFENTGTTTLLNLNFTIDLPLGWSAEINSVSINRLEPQESASLLFRITAPDSADEFLEVISIEFEATILETGENCTDSIPIIVAGKIEDNFSIWLIVIVGSVAGVASFNFVVIRRRRREGRIHALFTKVLNEDYRSTIQAPIMLEESHYKPQNYKDAVRESETITGSTLELNMSEQPDFTFARLYRAFCLLLNTFPLLGALYPGGTRFPQVMELMDLPAEKLHLFFSDHIEIIPHSEVLFHLNLMLNELKDAEENHHQILLFNKIEMLIDTAIAFQDRRLLNVLLQLVILIKCS